MNEPIAYFNKYLDESTSITRYKPENSRLLSSIALYTAEQPHPRVKMTQAEFDEFCQARLTYDNPHIFLSELDLGIVRSSFPNLYKWIYKDEHGEYLECSLLFYKLWVDYELKKHDDAIEIIDNMQWFVRSKEKNRGEYLYLKKSKDNSIIPWYTVYKDDALYFDTKDEAKLWENPLCEVVQLPVDECQ